MNLYTSKAHIIDAIIGNRKMMAVMTSNGEMQKLWWPRLDVFQQIDEWNFAISIDGYTNLLWLHDDMEWDFVQKYLDDSPIVLTKGRHKVLPISWQFIDFILPDKDVLIRRINIKNDSEKKMSIKLWQYSNFPIDERYRYNTTQYIDDIDGILHYRANTAIGLCSSKKISAFQCGGDVKSQIKGLNLAGEDQNMSSQGAVMWDYNTVYPQEDICIDIYLIADTSIEKIFKTMSSLKIRNTSDVQNDVCKYWHDIYFERNHIDIYNKKLNKLYNRSIMVFHLLSQSDLGSILAAPEVDEDFLYCGGYGFCWGRDAAYITCAIDAAGYYDMVDKFYEWTISAQSADGSWAQRHYLDGSIAPNWGIQIDETGSVLWGIWEHYKITKDKQFLSKMWPSIKKGAEFLISYLDDYTGLPSDSYDLWEERVAEHTYSAAAVYGGFIGASNIAAEMGFDAEAKGWTKNAIDIKKAIEKWCWDEETGYFLRSIKVDGEIHKDHIVDISVLGLVYPFKVLDANDKRIRATVKVIEDRLWSLKVGGIKRYENDVYRGGNPWILTTLWLTYYYTLIDENDRAKELFGWVVDHATPMGLFSEQIHRNTGKPAWVVPLTWSHAMFILTLRGLLDKELLE